MTKRVVASMALARGCLIGTLAVCFLATPASPQTVDLLGIPQGTSGVGPTGPVSFPPIPPKGPPIPVKGPVQGPSSMVVDGVVQVRTRLNVRASPWGPILATVGPNSRLRIIGRQGDWYVIEFEGRQAFVHSEYVHTDGNSPFGRGTGPWRIMDGGGAVVRGTPWGNPVAQLPAGAPVTVLGQTLNWYRVQAGGVTGYVPAPTLLPGTPMPPGPPMAAYGMPGYVGPGALPPNSGYSPGQMPVPPPPLYGPGSAPGRGARAARGPDKHPGTPTVNLQVFPVPGATRFNDDFGIGTHSPGASPYNMGIDIFAPEGSPIVAPVGSRVINVGSNRLGGLTVMLQAPDGTRHYFAHMSRHQPGIREGMTIPAGTVIGYVGHTGGTGAFPPHLHYSAVRNGQPYAPFRGLASCP